MLTGTQKLEMVKDIQNEEWYNNYAKQFVWDNWKMKLNIPIKLYKRESHRHGFFRFKVARTDSSNRKPVEIKLNMFRANQEEIIGTLKHELCHWYCFVTNKNFSDGDKDFEEALLSVGAPSTHGRSKEFSKLYQEGIVNGTVNRVGFKGMKFTQVDDRVYGVVCKDTKLDHDKYTRHYEKGYELKYENTVLGYIFKVGASHWVGISTKGFTIPSRECDYHSRVSRKSVAEILLKEHLNIK